MTPSPVECLLTLTRLTASFKDGKPPSTIKGSLSSSSDKDVCCCAKSSQHRENRESSLSSRLRGVQDRVRTFISDLRKRKRQAKLCKPSEIDSTIAGDQTKLRQVSELTGSPPPIFLRIPNMSSFSAAQKLDYARYEMSPDSQLPVEIYSPEPRSTSDNGDMWYQTDRKEVSSYDLQRYNTAMVSDTPIVEMPGDYPHFLAPDTDAGHATHAEWPSGSIELPHECYDTENYPQVTADSDAPVQDADPGLLSPQVTSYKSSPTQPETPAAPGSPSPGQHYFAADPSQSQGTNLFQYLIDSVALNSTAEVLISSFEGSTLVETLSGFDFDFDSSDQAFLEDVPKEDDVIDHLDWSGPPHALFEPYPQQVEDFQVDRFTLDSGSLVSYSIPGEGLEANVPDTRPVLKRAMTLPSRLPATRKLSLQEQRAREGTWQLDDDHNWTICNPSMPDQRIDEAESSLQGHAQAIPSSEGQSSGALDYLHVFQSRKHRAPRLGKLYCPVKCLHCDRKYTGQFAKGNMRRHMIHEHGHGRGRSYRCRMCNKSYRRSDARGAHERQMHPRHSL
jgi:hypothetical protein